MATATCERSAPHFRMPRLAPRANRFDALGVLSWAVAAQFGIDLERVRAFLRSKEWRRTAAPEERFERASGDAAVIVAEIAREVA